MLLKVITTKSRALQSKYFPITYLFDKFVESSFNISIISEQDIGNYTNPYNREWKISKESNTYYAVHPKKKDVLVEAKDFVRCIFNEQVDAIINYCARNANIKHISVQRAKDTGIVLDGNIEVEGAKSGAKYNYSANTSFFVEHDLNLEIISEDNDNAVWMDEFPEIKQFIGKFSSGQSRLISEYDYKQSFSLFFAGLFDFNVGDLSAGNKLIITIRS
ncbi:hypothetical protein [Paenibacillus sp. KR2-11]|uniref:hypothetical protein n=1 Tax=Paenibacillus sp. KR2-11 TaxID=3385500 RepID=UPI0038FC986B